MVDRLCQLRHFPVQCLAGKPDDAEQARPAVARSLLGPVQSGTLRIGVDQENGGALPLQLAGEMQRNGGLAGAALLGENGDDHGSLVHACGK